MVIKMGETSKMLVKFPSITDQAAWNEFVAEARKFYQDATPLGYLKEMDYKTWLENTIRLNIGSPLNDGEIPTSSFFVYDGPRLIGYLTIKRKNLNLDKVGQVYLNVRPNDRKKGYGDYILKAAIRKCKEIGIIKIIVSCPQESIGGIKLIENNGGVLQEEKELNGSGIIMKIYSIDIK